MLVFIFTIPSSAWCVIRATHGVLETVVCVRWVGMMAALSRIHRRPGQEPGEVHSFYGRAACWGMQLPRRRRQVKIHIIGAALVSAGAACPPDFSSENEQKRARSPWDQERDGHYSSAGAYRRQQPPRIETNKMVHFLSTLWYLCWCCSNID